MQKPIHHYNFWHGVLRRYVDLYLYTFYGKVTVIGKKNIPKNKPVILAINHQDALMDALTVLCTMKGQPVFMARADIFKSPTAAKILRFFKILPIYRIRDGIDSLQNNDAVFEQAVAVLEDSKRLAILPEGNHFGQRRLRVLKKGLARIAFQAEERHNFELDIQIVPVGLDYGHYINFGHGLMVKFGKPFSIAPFKDLYLENKQKGMNALMHELRKQMIPNMLHIDDSGNYNEIDDIKEVYINYLDRHKKVFNNHWERVKRSQKVADNLIALKNTNEQKFFDLADKAKYIRKNVNRLKLRLWTIHQKKYPALINVFQYLLLLLLAPVFLLGFITNIGPFYLPVLAAKKIKDPQFVSSIRFVVALVTFTLFYLIYLVLLLFFLKPFYLALGIFVIIPFIGYFSYTYYVWFKKVVAQSRVNHLHRTKNKIWSKIQAYRLQIIDALNH